MSPFQLCKDFLNPDPGPGDEGGGKVDEVRSFPNGFIVCFCGAEFFSLFHQLFPDELVVQGCGVRTGRRITEPVGNYRLKIFPGIMATGGEALPCAGMAGRTYRIHGCQNCVPVAVGPEAEQLESIAGTFPFHPKFVPCAAVKTKVSPFISFV